MKEKNKTVNAETRGERISLAIGIIVVLAVVATVLGLLIAGGARNGRVTAMGEISAPAEIRRGTEQTLTYASKELKKGDTVTWYVNGQKAAETTYDGNAATFVYTPDAAGKANVKAICGKCRQSKTLDVKNPVLTVSAPDVVITYGDELPQILCQTEGFVCGETAETLGCNFECRANDCTDVGVWEMKFCGQEPDGYEMHYNTARLTVLPKLVRIANTVTKEYDQTNTLANPKLILDGVLENDDVSAECDTMYFTTKNAGYQNVMTANICLKGDDAKNYVLSEYAQGYVAPKKICVAGVSVDNKIFDGTTKARINNPGTLEGVLEGDSVAIGSLDVCFDGANVGKHTATANGIVLIGVDKDNYVVSDAQIDDGEILAK
ncbi:MAG: YDG domain-containing protein [Corallococcus sp.]|nr:YDG domain-containing protein [Corallococcus sp.]MCM1359854.1 YDG domain-containing protein [Corallococcus sp.]MCM1395288.1 YDG domain-containing protein [Corallococcus sp.]